jgi:hypothetical protein
MRSTRPRQSCRGREQGVEPNGVALVEAGDETASGARVVLTRRGYLRMAGSGFERSVSAVSSEEETRCLPTTS